MYDVAKPCTLAISRTANARTALRYYLIILEEGWSICTQLRHETPYVNIDGELFLLTVG